MTDSLYEATIDVAGLSRRGRAAAVQLIARSVGLRIITFVGTALLARVLLPADFGTYAVISFLLLVLAPLNDFGLASALVQQQRAPSGREVGGVLAFEVAVAIGLVALVWLLVPVIALVLPLEADVQWMVRVASLALVLGALRAVPGAMMARELRFGPLAVIEVVQQVGFFAVAVALAVLGAGAWSFIWALMAYQVIGTLLVYVVWREHMEIALKLDIVRPMLPLGLRLQAAGIVLSLRDALIPLFGALGGGIAAIGYLQFAQRLGRVVGSVDEIVGRVAFPTFSRLQADRDRLARAMIRAVETTALLLVFVQAWMIVVAPALVPFVFSERWLPAVPVFQWIAIGTLAAVPATFLYGLGFALGEGRAILLWSLAAIAVAFVLFPALLIAFGLAGAGGAFAIYGLVQLLGYARATRHIAPFPWRRVLRIYGIGTVAAIAAAVITLADQTLLGILLSGLAFTGCFALLMIALEREQLQRLWQLARPGVTP